MRDNNIQEFINQQYGFSTWKDSDTAVKRLRCKTENYYAHLLLPPGEDEFYRDTPIFSCKFSPLQGSEHFLALANEEGKLAVHDINKNKRYGLHAHNNAIFDLAWTFDQMKIVTASGDHTSKLYSMGNGELKEERVFCSHTRSVKTVAFRRDDSSVFASGGRDGNIIVWDTRADVNCFIGRADRVINRCHVARLFTPSKGKKKFGTPPASGVKSVTGIVFQDYNTLISCGAGDGIIKVWDLRKNYLMHKKEAVPKLTIPYPGYTSKNGYSNLVIDDAGVKLYANCLDNNIYCYNVATYSPTPIMQYTGHQNSTFYVKSSLCKSGKYLISGSSDDNAYIWNTKNPKPLVKLTGHTAEVTCVAWCNSNFSVITCSDDMSHKLWTVGPEDLPENWVMYCWGGSEVVPFNEETSSKSGEKRRAELDEEMEYLSKKFIFECARCETLSPSQRFCPDCRVYPRKRQNSDDFGNENKRAMTEFGPRRLFTNGIQSIPEGNESLAKSLNPNDETLKAPPIEEEEPPKKIARVNSPTNDETLKVLPIEESEPPEKIAKLDSPASDETSKAPPTVETEPPEKIPKLNAPTTSRTPDLSSSPTVNLPNYVADGVAPHLNYSPPKKKPQDWLTRIRVEKNLRQEMYDRTVGPSTPKTPRLESPSRSRGPSSPRSPLLRFFKVTNSVQTAKSPNSSGFVATNLRPSQ